MKLLDGTMPFLRPVSAALQSLLLQRDRWGLWLPVIFACGIVLYFSLKFEPWVFTGWAAYAVLLGFYIAAGARRAGLRLVLLGLMVAALGFSAAQLRTVSVAAPVLHKKIWPAPVVTGRVIDVDPLEKSWRVTLDRLSFDVQDKRQALPERVRIKLKNNDPALPQTGDIVKIRAVLSPLPSPVLPEAFDFQRHAYFMQLGATGYALSNLERIAPRHEMFLFGHLRDIIRARVDGADVADKNTNGLIKAFLIGDDKAIAATDMDIARKSGIAHLVAISGSHFVMIVGVTFFLIRAALAAVPAFALRYPVKKIAALAGMFAAVFYMLLIDMPIPAQRATVMSCVVMLAIMLDRDPFSLRIAAFAALCVLLVRPESLMGASFQLSFAAVVGLLAFFESTRGFWMRLRQNGNIWRKVVFVLFACFSTTFVAGLATAPFALYHFLTVPFFAGLVANMVAVPLSSFITFPVGMLACLLMPLGMESGALWVMARSIEIIMRVAEIVASWPGMDVSVNAWPGLALGGVSFGALWICLWQGKIRWLGVIPVFLAVMFALRTPRPDVLIGPPFRMLAAVRADDGGLWVSGGRRDAFVRKVWAEREGMKGVAPWPQEGALSPDMVCDARACRYEHAGLSTVFIKQTDAPPEFRRKNDKTPEMDVAALIRDCQTADIVVLPMAEMPPECGWFGENIRARVIDKWDLYRQGAHAIYLGWLDGYKITTVHDTRGKRPWVRMP